MKNLYSYNQLKALYGENDNQVIKIHAYLIGIGFTIENKTIEAFKRVTDKN